METASQIWQRFAALPGAAMNNNIGIASEHAIGGLIDVIHRYHPLRILEFGSGIGTLTYTVLHTTAAQGLNAVPGFTFYTVENNEFCLEQLGINLQNFDASQYTLVHAPDDIPAELKFDLIIVDGGGDVGNDMGVMEFGNRLNPGGVIFIEGFRRFQRGLVQQWYGSRPHAEISLYPARMSVQSTATGLVAKNKSYHLFVFEPSAPENLRLWLVRLWNSTFTRLARRLAAAKG
jgi:predicted O-methyltransferase YrrM